MPRLPPQVIALGVVALAAAHAHGSPSLTARKIAAPAGEGGDCASCHEDAWRGQAVVHPPVKNGLCGACHVSTSTLAHTFALRASDGALCAQCHASRSLQEVKHPPVSEGLCLACHDPHASEHPVRLRRSIFDTCTSCHPSKRVQDAASATRHGALDPAHNERVCVACHDPHQGEHPKRLRAWPPEQVCVGCHDRVIEADSGPLIDIQRWLARHPEKWMRHGPVREGLCHECHEPHGTDHFRMLKGSYPSSFYEPFQEGDTYGICFRCHDRRLVETPTLAEKAPSHADPSQDLSWLFRPEGDRLVRAGVTGFRNGDENLHVRHVNRIDKGRTCRACHDVHASENPKHIRTTTPFGGWEFPLQFQKTLTGGACTPGCHAERRYDRETRQVNLK